MVRVLLCVAVSVGFYVACARDIGDHPPPLGDCTDPECVSVVGRPPVGSGAMAGGSGGLGGGAGVEPGTLAGSVRIVTSGDLTEVRPLTDPVAVKSRGAGGVLEVSTTTESDGSFLLEGVDEDSGLWVGAGPFDGSSVGLYLDTVQVVNTTRDTEKDLLVMTRGVVEEIALTSFMGSPTEFNVQRGTAIVTFLDNTQDQIQGLTVLVPAVPDVSIAYDAGDIYSDLQEGTSARGTVVIMNAAAGPFPGSPLNIVVLVNGLEYSSSVRVVRGGVTLATAQLPIN